MVKATANLQAQLPTDPAQPLTVDEVAAWLRVGANAIYDALREGKLQGMKVGKSWRISRQALDDFVNGVDK